MKRIISLLFGMMLFSTSDTFAQQNSTTVGEIYAIVVGISNYRYIRPLSYADRDADLFSEMLRSGTGGRIKPENLFLMKNDSANAGNFWSALLRICNNNKIKKGDRVFIYFAGHGDAIKGLNEYYLLLSDCQPANDGNNYHLSFGAVDMYHLKNRIGLLTAKGVEVILILDACRTNELAGGYASQVFNSSIIQTSVGEIAMLATGPGQVSIEDASFGNGHGLFTYNLIDALSGRADKEPGGNNDETTSLEEINQWVKKNVELMSEKFHIIQSPVFCCDEKNNTAIGIVDSSFSMAWNQLKELNTTNNPAVIYAGKTQRSNDLAVDSGLVALYNKFNTARKENKLWGDSSANNYYDQMEKHFPGERTTDDARYALAADFINFAQQKINLYLEGKDLLSLEVMREKTDSSYRPDFLTDEFALMKKTVSEKWTIAGLMIEKAGKLLSEKDSSILRQLKPKIDFLLARGYVSEEQESKLTYSQALEHATEAYLADSNAAYTAEGLGLLYAYRRSLSFILRSKGYLLPDLEIAIFNSISDTASYYFKKAILLAPKWVNAFRSIGLKLYGFSNSDSAIVYMKRALDINPEDGRTYILLGDLYQPSKPDSSNYYYRYAIKLTPQSAHAEIYNKIARSFFRYEINKWILHNPDSIIYYSNKALFIDSKNTNANMNIGEVFELQNKNDSALKYYKNVIKQSPGYVRGYNFIAGIYEKRNMPDSIFYYYKKLLDAAPQNRTAISEIARYYDNKVGYQDSAIIYYKKQVALNYLNQVSKERLAYIYMKQDKNDSALVYFTDLLTESTSTYSAYYNLACYYSYVQKIDESIKYLEKALQKGLRNWKQIHSDPYLSFIRNTEQFKKLMTKYFHG